MTSAQIVFRRAAEAYAARPGAHEYTQLAMAAMDWKREFERERAGKGAPAADERSEAPTGCPHTPWAYFQHTPWRYRRPHRHGPVPGADQAAAHQPGGLVVSIDPIVAVQGSIALNRSPDGRAGLRAGLGDAACICDAMANELTAKRRTTLMQREIAAALRAAGDAIWKAREAVDIPGGITHAPDSPLLRSQDDFGRRYASRTHMLDSGPVKPVDPTIAAEDPA